MIRVFVPAPDLPLVNRRKTGKLTKPNPWLTSNQRRHRMDQANLEALWRAEGAKIFEGIPPMEKVLIRAYVWRGRGGRYDPGNFYPSAKNAVDGIVDAGVLVDDSHEYVTGPDMRHGGVSKSAVGLEFVLEEISRE